MEEIAVQGLVVKEAFMGDHDKILTLMTPDRGLITVTGKGVRSFKSKNAAACQPFTYSYFLLRKSNKYFYVAETETIETFFELKCSLDGLALAAYVCDVSEALSVEGMGDPELLRLTLNTLYAIDQKLYPYDHIKASFEMRASAVAGFLPDLTGCDLCEKLPEGDMYLDIMNGRILCKECKPVAEADEIASESGTARLYFIISPTVLYAMRYIVSAPSNKFMSFSIDEEELHLLGKATEMYLCNHIERGFFTLEFYKDIYDYE